MFENLPKFEGACMDIGAPRSLIGLKQAKAFYKAQGTFFETTYCRKTYSFGPYPTRSIGKMRVVLPIKDSSTSAQVDVLSEAILFLTGVGIMEFRGLQPPAVERKLYGVKGD